ncbi:MAG: peptidase, partial [Gemmatimonadota bacterium]|nr:peptidase [Gemmatimonadota bacterium]
MLSRFQRLLVLFGLVVFYPVQSVALQQDIPSVEEKTASMQEIEGYFNVFWDDATGKLFWEIDKWNTEFLYAVSMASGLGSNPVGIDRGQLGGSYVLTATRVGPKVLLVEPNYRYRALSDNPEEVEAVR